MKLRFTLRAAGNLAEIADYLRERNPAAAQRVRAAILESLGLLSTFPELGRHQTTEGVRKLVTRKYRYVVYYTVDTVASEVVILSIQHPARRREHQDA